MNNIKFSLLVFAFLILSMNCYSQPYTEWIQRYNSPGNFNDDLVDMVLDKYGNIFITGNTGNPTDIVTLKYSSSGNLLWSRIYNGPFNRDDEAVKIAVDDSGFVYVAGNTFNTITFNNYLLIKYSPNGDNIWIREFNEGDSTTEFPRDMVIDKFSNIYITGDGGICGLCPSDYLTVKFYKNGNLLWSKRYHGEGYFSNLGWTLALDNSDRVIVSGKSADINNTYYNATVIYNSNGDFIKRIRIDTAEVRRLEVDDFNNFYIGGYKKSPNPPTNTDIFLNKYDSSGNLLWNKHYGSNSIINRNDYLSWMLLDQNEQNIYITGLSNLNNQNGWNFLLLNYNIDGDSLWARGYSPVNNSDNQSVHMAVDKLNNTYVTGNADFNTPYRRFLTVKYDSAGNFIWAANYLNILFYNHYGKRVAVDSNSSVLVGGTSFGPESGSNDIVLIKYSQITNVQNTSNQIPEQMKLFQNYPNPFNPLTNIDYHLTITGSVKVSIFDILGKEIAVLVNEKQNQGSYKVKWDAADFSSGMYFYKMEVNGNVIDTKKLLLIK